MSAFPFPPWNVLVLPSGPGASPDSPRSPPYTSLFLVLSPLPWGHLQGVSLLDADFLGEEAVPFPSMTLGPLLSSWHRVGMVVCLGDRHGE